MVAKRCPPRARWFFEAFFRLSTMILRRRHRLRRSCSHQLRFSSSSIKVRFLHRRITKKLRFSYIRDDDKRRDVLLSFKAKSSRSFKGVCVCCVSSLLSSLCDETEGVKKRKILAGKKFVRSESAKARAVVLVSRCVVGMVFLLLLRF